MSAKRLMLYHERKLSRQGKKQVAGIDEAGRGPLAGPVVAAAVILRDLRFKNRIADSKVLSRFARERAYEEILRKADIGIGIVGEKDIDRINILRASLHAMELAVYDLGIRPDHLLIDGNIQPELPHPKTTLIGGESRSISIACASIVAKVTRDFIMTYYDALYPEYGFARHKGYGTRLHFIAIRRFGPSPIHRRSFTLIK
ncbi:MAG: ribonuclease HII [Candidatus Omnitrophica bacterium]|nr:ribonuclease HII [Candidatus Omnitrophota bacterium]MDD5310725.1 ribonuclease HII [Candidatus Omnitrophota bacterium]